MPPPFREVADYLVVRVIGVILRRVEVSRRVAATARAVFAITHRDSLSIGLMK